MPFKVVSGVGRGIGVLDGVVIIRAEGAVLGVNVGRPIVTSGPLLHSCVEMREPIELLFGVVSWVGPGIGVWNGVHVAQGDGVDFGVVCLHWSNGFSGLIFKRNVFDSCVKS